MALDPKLLEQTRAARLALFEAQYAADKAQLRFQHAIRELHAAGASLREIADELEMSHQRVHQLIDPGSGKGALRSGRTKRRGRSQDELRHCSFCGRSQKDVAKLIAGPGVYICDRCIDDQLASIAGGEGVEDASVKCSFCAKRRRQVEGIAAGIDVTICNECLALCVEIITEELGSDDS